MIWFLDMCIILYYIDEGNGKNLVKKSKEFVKKKGNDKFLLCYYIKEENLPKWLKRQKIVYRELVRQIKDYNYIPYSDNECVDLYERDKNEIIKLLASFRNFSNKLEIIEKLEKVYLEIERRITSFITEKIDDFIIPIKDIHFNLKSCLFTFLGSNDSDAKTLASAIQEHNKRNLVIITADKKDWTEALLGFVHDDPKLKALYPKLPKIRYIQNF